MQAFEFTSRTVCGPTTEPLDVNDAIEALQAEGCPVADFRFAASEGTFAAMVPARRDRKGG